MEETRACQNCKQNFVIESEDFAFYNRIQVPLPTFCPDCRSQRRMTWRNERTLYHTKCAATGKSVISMFDPESPIVVYDRDYWWSDNWDQLSTGRDYDFSKLFFTQFRELLEKAPLPNLANTNAINSDYGNHNADVKNCYLTYASYKAENVAYSNGALESKESYDIYIAEWIEQSYDITFCGKLNQCSFCYDSDESLNSQFLLCCKNLTHCLGCVNLISKSHHIFNQPYTKEEYKQEIEKLDLGSYKNFQRFKEKYQAFAQKYPRRFASIIKSSNVLGDMVMNGKNLSYCFDVYDTSEDSKYAIHASGMKDCYDGYGFGLGELLYEGVDSGLEASNYKFTVYTHKCRDVDYTYGCISSEHLFGCVGLRNKKYCILNKQYTKEEYETLVPKIKKHMNEMPYVDQKGRVYKYGEFFPAETSPFSYNETIAQEYFPINQEIAKAKGFPWKTLKEKNYQATLKAIDLPDHIKDVTDGILKEVISCEHEGKCEEQCTTAFKILPQELEFYRRHNLPLPRLCPNCRHYRRLKQRNPFKLWHRKCQCDGAQSENGIYQNTAKHPHGQEHCLNEFETPFSPDKPETVYCDVCYQQETR